MDRKFELGPDNPDPIDEAIHLNTPKEWEKALGERAWDDSFQGLQDTIPAMPAKLLRDQMQDILKGMHPQEERVLALRFGLEDGRSKTLREVAEIMGFSKSTAWRREKSALEVLRSNSARRKKLSDYLDI